MTFSDLTKFPKHPLQADNEHLLKVIFQTKSGDELTQQQAEKVLEEAELDQSSIHIAGVSKMGKEFIEELTGIYVSATSQENAEEALGRLTISASMSGFELNRRTFNQSQF